MTATSEESGATDTWAEEAPTLAGLAASVQGLIALGPRTGTRVARYGSPPEEVGPACAWSRTKEMIPQAGRVTAAICGPS